MQQSHLATVIDAFSRRVVGRSMAPHLRTEIVLDAFNMAVWNRRSGEGRVQHSDNGCQLGLNRWSQHFDRGGVDGTASGG